jgi:HlyD family secretion protein
VKSKRVRNRWIIAVAASVTLVLVSWGISRLGPAVPSVDQETLWIGTVERGPMMREIRGHGTLAPVEIRWIPAVTSGRVERILVEPGERVERGQPLMILSNPEVEQAALDAASALRRSEAELVSLGVRLRSEQLNQQAQAAAVEAEYVQAKLQLEADRALSEQGLIADLELHKSEAVAASLVTRREIEEERLEMTTRSIEAQLEAKRAAVEQQRAMAELRADQLRSLEVRSGLAGVVQEIPVEVGRQLAPGTSLALVAETSRLKAELHIPATRAGEVKPGQPVAVDTRNGVVTGMVARIDPAVREATVLLEVELTGDLPGGARPEMRVEGVVQTARLDDVLFTRRPVSIPENGSVGLFRLEEDGATAVRVPVRLGLSSVKHVEVREGLAEGDRVIVSDTSSWDSHDRIRLK